MERDVYASRYAARKRIGQKGVKKVQKKTKRTPNRQNKGREIRRSGDLQKPEPLFRRALFVDGVSFSTVPENMGQ